MQVSVRNRVKKAVRFFWLSRGERAYLRRIRASRAFDRAFYKGVNGWLHPLFQSFPERHYVALGEAMGLQPTPEFAPRDYLSMNNDLAPGVPAFDHYLRYGRAEGRPTRAMAHITTDWVDPPVIRPKPRKADYAVVAHLYYPDLWPEFQATIEALDLEVDLFVTLTHRGPESDALKCEIEGRFPSARVWILPNHGRDIFPFVHLVNAGVLAGYKAVAKIHTKKSPHRQDGETWRKHLIQSILPGKGTAALVARFLDDLDAGILVAAGQAYEGARWWGSNQTITADLLQRLGIRMDADRLRFPAGSIYWLKPLMVQMLAALDLSVDDFGAEAGQVDGTVAHGIERVLGYFASAAGQVLREVPELVLSRVTPKRVAPNYVSAFYLPQFHPIPENDQWWGAGYTEWRAAAKARPLYPGHAQPVLPGALGFYDLRHTDVMGAQAAMAAEAGVDAFAVYHYWFDEKRVLEAPLDGLLERADVAFPFYLCWANESWRRNWDGLSGEVLLDQAYAPGFEARLVKSTLPYMQDPRYQRPDGVRPRFMIYRPEDMPDPVANVAALRKAWRRAGIGEVELGAVAFHVKGAAAVDEALFDFWVEMPPHGLVTSDAYLVGGPNPPVLNMAPGFQGLVYDIDAVIQRSLTPDYVATLPQNTIAGVMPSWDNTARRGVSGHMAHGATPASFQKWLTGLSQHRIAGSYNQELFVNAWNEWAENACLEPDLMWGQAWLEALSQITDRSKEALHVTTDPAHRYA